MVQSSQQGISTTHVVFALVGLAFLTLAGDMYFVLGPVLSNARLARQQHLGDRNSSSLHMLIPSSSQSQQRVNQPQQGGRDAINGGGGNSKEHVLAVMKEAGITLTPELIQQLPTWKQVTDQHGHKPLILGLESCSTFRQQVPAVERMLGAAGMFSTGTNLVTVLLKQNCYIPERQTMYGVNATKELLGMRWQVPWGKHTPAHYKYQHATTKAAAIDKDAILPVVSIRHPIRWMQSMCKNPYSAKWPHFSKCPKLLQDDGITWNNVTVKYGVGSDQYQSLAHLWNDWYHEYTESSSSSNNNKYPWIMIRIEDLVFYTKETVKQVCECAGGALRTDQPFRYVADSAKKDSPGHDTTTGYAQAWIKYSKPLQVQGGFAPDDFKAAVQVLDADLMQQFGYTHPPPV